jgi:MoaA/NifB/PqqE/SkfB family radical SAM enzyme
MCKAWQDGPKINDLPTEDVFRAIDVLDKMGVCVLSLTGGEPLLRKDIYEIIKYARKKGLYVMTNSNGTMPIKEYKKLIESGINRIGVSLGSLDSKKQSYINRIPNTLEKAIKAIKYLRKNKKRGQLINVSCTVSSLNMDEVPNLIEYCSTKLKVPIVIQPVVLGAGDFLLRSNDTEMRITDAEKMNKMLDKVIKMMFFYKVLGTRSFFDYCKRSLKKDFKWKCRAGTLFYDIMPDGKFGICLDFSMNKNLLDKDFLEWWGSESTNKKIKKLRRSCPSCTWACYMGTQFIFDKPWELLELGPRFLLNKMYEFLSG